MTFITLFAAVGLKSAQEMSDEEQENMAGGAESRLLKETAPKHEAKPLPKSASHEKSSEIQQLVNTLFQALK